MVEKHKAKILVVEDDPAILQGLSDVFVYNGYKVRGIDNGAKGCEVALAQNYDLLVLDVMLPEMDGFTICRRVRAVKPDQPIMMLTAKGAEDDVVTGFQAGADDYVSKPFSLRELMVRVEAILRRSGKRMPEQQLMLASIKFDPNTLIASCREQQREITRREMDIMSYLYRYRGRIVTRGELLENVWGYLTPDIETRTVDIHIQKLRKKIADLIGDIPMVVTVRGEGYRLENHE